MENYHDFELSQLIDMLAECTARYTNMMNDGFHHGEEFAQLGEQIQHIQQTIWVKRGFKDGE